MQEESRYDIAKTTAQRLRLAGIIGILLPVVVAGTAAQTPPAIGWAAFILCVIGGVICLGTAHNIMHDKNHGLRSKR